MKLLFVRLSCLEIVSLKIGLSLDSAPVICSTNELRQFLFSAFYGPKYVVPSFWDTDKRIFPLPKNHEALWKKVAIPPRFGYSRP